MNAIVAATVGLLVGLHAALWGIYKDAPHEGFSARKFSRSPLFGLVIAVAAQAASGLDAGHPGDLVVLFGVVYALERALAEIYKTFLREEDQSKYFIPMQFHVLGRIVESRAVRRAVGGAYAAVLLATMAGVRAFDHAHPGPRPWLAIIGLGSLGGWISAFGGAWKDAPREGFQTLKFFRSPTIAAILALGISRLTPDLLLMTLAATGFTIACTETYKTFFFPSTPRGKFAGMPVRHPEMLERRRLCVPPFVAIWAGLLAAAAGSARV